jgi:hypothetical protein
LTVASSALGWTPVSSTASGSGSQELFSNVLVISFEKFYISCINTGCSSSAVTLWPIILHPGTTEDTGFYLHNAFQSFFCYRPTFWSVSKHWYEEFNVRSFWYLPSNAGL